MNNENKKEYESNNNNKEGIFYDKPNYNENITLSRLIPLDSNGHKLLIGKGAFSNVYLYKDIITQEKYALKIMDKNFILKNLETLQIIYNEIEIQSRINHPNIIRLYNIYENSNTIYMIMEYLNNGNLFSLIRRKKGLNEIEAYKYFSQIVNAIKFLHNNNIIHRDIKPENILLDNKYTCKLCDFGWSVILQDNSSRNTFCGTIEYMAPEIINNEQYDKSIDIWSLGVLLFEMIHGFNPFENNKNNINLLIENIKNKKVKFEKNISDECKDLIMKMLESNCNKRICIDDILNHPFMINNKNYYEKKFERENVDDDDLTINRPYIHNFHCTPEKEKQIVRTKTINKISHFNVFDDNNNNLISVKKIKNFTNSLLFDDEEEKSKEILHPKSSKNLQMHSSLINHLSNIKPKKLRFEMEIPVNKNSNNNQFNKNKSVNFFNTKNLTDNNDNNNNNNNKSDYTIKIIKSKNNTQIIITKQNLKLIQNDEFLEPFELI